MHVALPMWQNAGAAGYACVTWTPPGATALWTYPDLGNYFDVVFDNPNSVAVTVNLTKFTSPLIPGPTSTTTIPALSSKAIHCGFDPVVIPPASAGIAEVLVNGGSAYVGVKKVCDFDIEFDST